MPEAQYVVSGFNIAGLDPIEVAKPVTGTTLTLADSDIGKMNVFTGSANTTVTLPSAAGNLDGYSKAGRMIGLRGGSSMTAKITTSGLTPARSLLDNHRLILVSNGTSWEIHQHYWPPGTGYVYAYRSTNVALSVGVNNVVCDTVADGNSDGWYNTTTGVYSPTLPGLYDFKMAGLATNGATTNIYLPYIGKNGSPLKCSGRIVVTPSQSLGGSTDAMLYADGISDSFRAMFQVTASGTTLLSTIVETYFEARYIGPV